MPEPAPLTFVNLIAILAFVALSRVRVFGLRRLRWAFVRHGGRVGP